jgi:Na+-driven multidrug efflux pump
VLAFALGFGVRGVWLGLFVGLLAAGGLLTLRFESLSRRLARDLTANNPVPFSAV